MYNVRFANLNKLNKYNMYQAILKNKADSKNPLYQYKLRPVA